MPRFGIFVLPVMASDSAHDARFEIESATEDVMFADDLGFTNAWLAEHHGTRYGGACPSATLFAAYLASRTKTIILGTAVSVVPLQNPIRLAEQALLLDHLTGGRFELGIGSGFLAIDFETLGVNLEKKQELLTEGLHRLAESLKSAEPIPTLQSRAHIYPTRWRADPIPIWGAAAKSSESIITFAAAGIGLMLNPYTRSIEEIERSISLYRERLLEEGVTVDQARVLIHEHLFVADTEELARDIPEEFLMTYLASLQEASDLSVSGMKTTHNSGPQAYKKMFPEHVAFGTPSQVTERIAQWIQRGVTDFAFSVRFGGMPKEIAHASMALFAREVAPHFTSSQSST